MSVQKYNESDFTLGLSTHRINTFVSEGKRVNVTPEVLYCFSTAHWLLLLRWRCPRKHGFIWRSRCSTDAAVADKKPYSAGSGNSGGASERLASTGLGLDDT
jgi:hypothetical protein